MAENPPKEPRNSRGEHHCDNKAILIVFHAIYEVHTKEACYERWKHEYDRHGC